MKSAEVKVVELTEGLDVQVVEIANILGLHPVMVYRWRQEYREGDLTYSPSRRVSMTKNKPKIKEKKNTDLERLKKENIRLIKENDFLKKYQRYLKDQKESGLCS